MSFAALLIAGFLLGLKHATEADHVAAVAALAIRCDSLAQAIRVGCAWGVGHTLTLMLFGGAVLVLGLGVPQHAAQALELAVGLMLALLGFDALRRLRRERIHFHVHRHAEWPVHFHAHSHRGETMPHDPAQHQHPHPRTHATSARALAVGFVHGMAGSAALILLTLDTAPSVAWGIAYIAVFGLGSMLGMAALSLVIAIPLRASANRPDWIHAGFSGAVGAATLALGLFIVYHIGYAQGFLLACPDAAMYSACFAPLGRALA